MEQLWGLLPNMQIDYKVLAEKYRNQRNISQDEAAMLAAALETTQGLLSEAQGSVYIRSNGNNTTNRAYINTDGNTAWTAITTVA